jgi:pimeloyl-ACP methyl ester carboxylesterase
MEHALTRVEGVEVHSAAAGSGRPVVLVHGLGDSHRTWDRIVPALAQTRRVLAPDLPGHGLSERPDASYTLDWYSHMLARWVDAMGLEDVDVVGHSFGGGVAQRLLLDLPGRVRRLALVAPGGLGREVGLGLRLLSLTPLVERIGQPFMAPFTRLGLRALGDVYDDEEIGWLAWTNGRPGSARGLSRTVRDVIDWRGQTRHFLDSAHEVAALPPLALYWGTRDPVIPIGQAHRTAGLLEGALFTPFECGHFPHRERADSFARALVGFLEAPWLPTPRLLHRSLRRAAPARLSLWSRAWRAVSAAVRRFFVRPAPA